MFADAKKYACSSYVNGGACSNKTRVRRDTLEREIIGPIKDKLLDPEQVKRMAKQLEKRLAEQAKATQQKGADAPRELAELDARIARLKERLRTGDPDLTEDELQAAIDRAQTKRQELAVSQPVSGAARILTMLPRAAEIYRQHVIAGLEGKDPEATAKARSMLRDLIGTVTIKAEAGGEVWGEFEAQPAALLRVTVRFRAHR